VKHLNEHEGSSFTLRITGTENGEWQGVLECESGAKTRFNSLLELLREMSAELECTGDSAADDPA